MYFVDRKNDQPCRPLPGDSRGTSTLEGPVLYKWIGEGDKAEGCGDEDPDEVKRRQGYLQDGDEDREWPQKTLRAQCRQSDLSLWDWTVE